MRTQEEKKKVEVKRNSISSIQGLHYIIVNSSVFQPKILLEGESGPWRLVLGAIFLGKGPIDNNW